MKLEGVWKNLNRKFFCPTATKNLYLVFVRMFLMSFQAVKEEESVDDTQKEDCTIRCNLQGKKSDSKNRLFI